MKVGIQRISRETYVKLLDSVLTRTTGNHSKLQPSISLVVEVMFSLLIPLDTSTGVLRIILI